MFVKFKLVCWQSLEKNGQNGTKRSCSIGNYLEMTWSPQQKAKCLLAEKMTFVLVMVATKIVVQKTGQVIWRSQK